MSEHAVTGVAGQQLAQTRVFSDCLLTLASKMPALSRFAKNQTVAFLILAKTEEMQWKPPTIVLRCATVSGDEFELHMVSQAFAQGQKMTVGSSYSAAIDSGSVKPYRAAERRGKSKIQRVLGKIVVDCSAVPDRTGIAAELYVRSGGDVKLSKTVAAIQPALPETYLHPKDFAQLEGLQNIAGRVVSVGPLMKNQGQLPKRSISLEHGEYDYSVDFIGVLAGHPPEVEDVILVMGVKLALYYNIPSLETTRLSYWRKTSAVIPKAEIGGRQSKALKADIPETTVAMLSEVPPETAVLVIGKIKEISPSEVEEVILFTNGGMKYTATLEGDGSEVKVDWWSNENGFQDMMQGSVKWQDLWEKCETEEGRNAFAAQINMVAGKKVALILRPRQWQGGVVWTVHKSA